MPGAISLDPPLYLAPKRRELDARRCARELPFEEQIEFFQLPARLAARRATVHMGTHRVALGRAQLAV
jgi:hypothetical protein